MRMIPVAIAALALIASPAFAQQKPAVDPARVDAAIKAGFAAEPADWASRLSQDETMKECSAAHNNPSKAVAAGIVKREKATIVYPADGKFLGDWKKGEKIAQSGYGFRFTDYPAKNPNGGNCYACHQISKQEVSYGTLGPSLLGYGKQHNFDGGAAKAVYEKIYNSQAALACSNMPRFGANKILTMEQIKDAVALLMSPDSPVNK